MFDEETELKTLLKIEQERNRYLERVLSDLLASLTSNVNSIKAIR